MEEIKVEIGEYVRTKKGYIGKVIRFDVDNNLHCDNIISTMCGENFWWLNKLEQKEQIAKHSKNIIDLIEVGDYVNGHLVIAVDREKLEVSIENCMYGSDYEDINGNIDIKSIVTKERFKAMEYEVEKCK